MLWSTFGRDHRRQQPDMRKEHHILRRFQFVLQMIGWRSIWNTRVITTPKHRSFSPELFTTLIAIHLTSFIFLQSNTKAASATSSDWIYLSPRPHACDLIRSDTYSHRVCSARWRTLKSRGYLRTVSRSLVEASLWLFDCFRFHRRSM